jgi:hypothetical protein
MLSEYAYQFFAPPLALAKHWISLEEIIVLLNDGTTAKEAR